MCLISLIAFKMAFTSKPFDVPKSGDDIKEDFFSKKLMYPRFKDLVLSTIENKEKLTKEPYETLEVVSKEGYKLRGYYFENKVKTDKTIVLVHGYQSTGFKDHSSNGYYYLTHGFNILIVDNRASGQSEGKYLTFGIKESEDVAIWCNKLVELNPNVQIVLHGTSLGGASVCMASNLDLPSNVKSIVSDCSFVDIKSEFKHMVWDLFHVPTWPITSIMSCWAKKIDGFDFTTRTPLKSVKEAKVPIIFVHGKEDVFIKPESANILYDACSSEKELLFIDGCGHAESQLDKDNYYPNIIKFMSKFFS